MSDYQRKYRAALDELTAAGVPKRQFESLWSKGMKLLGRKVRPPLYESLLKVALISGVWFGIGFGVLIWLFLWREQGFHFFAVATGAFAAGGLNGLFMAGLLAYSRRKWKLSHWEEL